MQKAKALKGIGSNAEALRSIRQVIAEDSTNQQAHIEAAECCKAMAKYNDALDYYRKAISLNPKTSMPVCNSSTCFATPKTMLRLLEKVQ